MPRVFLTLYGLLLDCFLEHRNVAAATQVPKDDAQDYSGKKVEDEKAEEARENVQEETKEQRKIRIQMEKERKEKEEEEKARKKEWEEENKVPILTFGNI